MGRRSLSGVFVAAVVAALLQVGTPPGTAVVHAGGALNPRFDAKGTGRLSARLSELAGSAQLRTATPRAQARALWLPAKGAGSLMRRGGRLMVEIRVARTTGAEVHALRSSGARIVHVSHRYATVTAYVGIGSLRAVAGVRGVRNVQEVQTPMLAGTSAVGGNAPQPSATCPQGNATSEGDAQLRADLERAQLGGTGAGITVGVLSDSYDRWTGAPTHAAQDVTSGDLPGAGNPCGQTTPVNVIDDSDTSGEDEGRAMLQVVHDLAPSANLAFATAFTSETAFADNIRALANAGAKVIVDDVTYFDEPFYQDGPVADAVNDVTAQGVVYYSSAANNNVVSGGQNVGSWEAPSYRPTACPGTVTGYTDCMDFNPGAAADSTYGVTLQGSASLRLEMQYAEPWYGLTDNLHLLVLNAANTVLGDFSTNGITPFTSFLLTNGSSAANFNIVIARPAGSTGTPRVKLAFLQNGLTGAVPNEYTSSSGGDVVGPTIFGHNGGPNTISVAAVPYNNSATPEYYSSRGPVTELFGPVNGTTPAAPLAAPLVLAKPDIAATDCGLTTFFIGSPPYRFCGTSEAAPHAAAIAALEKSLNPGVSRAALIASQKSTARAVGAFGPSDVGAGLIDALAATDAVTSRLTVTKNGSGSVTSSDGHVNCGSVCSYGYVPGSSTTLTGTPGPGVFLQWTGCDSVSGNQCTVSLASDRNVTASFAPDSTPPTARMFKPSARVSLGKKISLQWGGTDTAGSGVKSFTVQVAKATFSGKLGSYSSVASLTGTTATSAKLKEKYGATYCFRVSATDNAGNVSAYSAARCTTLPVDDRTLKASPGWKRTHGHTPSHTLSVSSKKGATLTLKHVRAKRVGVVVMTCKTCGTITLSFAGHKVASVNLKSKHTKTKVVLAKSFGKVKKGTLVVKVGSSKKVQVDGVVVQPSLAKAGRPLGVQR
jgi:hypothetical protein